MLSFTTLYEVEHVSRTEHLLNDIWWLHVQLRDDDIWSPVQLRFSSREKSHRWILTYSESKIIKNKHTSLAEPTEQEKRIHLLKEKQNNWLRINYVAGGWFTAVKRIQYILKNPTLMLGCTNIATRTRNKAKTTLRMVKVAGVLLDSFQEADWSVVPSF